MVLVVFSVPPTTLRTCALLGVFVENWLILFDMDETIKKLSSFFGPVRLLKNLLNTRYFPFAIYDSGRLF